MPQTLHEKLDSLGNRQVRTLDEIERSSQENLVMARSIRESLAAQTEVLRSQVVTLDRLRAQIERSIEESATRETERAGLEIERAERETERAEREAELAREHDARMKAFEARSEAQHEMFRLAMVQLLDRLSGD